MDGENNGKPYEQMDDLEVPLFLETPIYIYCMIYLDSKPTLRTNWSLKNLIVQHGVFQVFFTGRGDNPIYR